MAQEMIIKLAIDPDRQFLGMRPIQLHRSARRPVLRKEDLLIRPMFQPPQLDPPLEGSQKFLRHQSRGLFGQMLKEHFGFQFRGLLENLLGRGPNRR